ncbi:hypothetical protein Tco_1252523 [Tanacetum coccineum]
MTILVHFTNCPSTSEKLPLVPWPTPTSYSSDSVKVHMNSITVNSERRKRRILKIQGMKIVSSMYRGKPEFISGKDGHVSKNDDEMLVLQRLYMNNLDALCRSVTIPLQEYTRSSS